MRLHFGPPRGIKRYQPLAPPRPRCEDVRGAMQVTIHVGACQRPDCPVKAIYEAIKASNAEQ